MFFQVSFCWFSRLLLFQKQSNLLFMTIYLKNNNNGKPGLLAINSATICVPAFGTLCSKLKLAIVFFLIDKSFYLHMKDWVGWNVCCLLILYYGHNVKKFIVLYWIRKCFIISNWQNINILNEIFRSVNYPKRKRIFGILLPTHFYYE